MRPSSAVLCAFSLLGMALLLWTVPVWAQDKPEDRATLKGITAVQVVVEVLTPDVERDGLTKSQLEADVESHLRHAGIPVLRSSSDVLHVSVTAENSTTGHSYADVIRVTFEQPVRDLSSPEILRSSVTWGVSRFGTVEAARLHTVRSEVADLVDKFIAAYLEQNPKK